MKRLDGRAMIRRCVADARIVAAAIRRRLFPTRMEAARRHILELAQQQARYVPGRLSVLDLDLDYVDALTLSTQWLDIFERETLAFRASSPMPRILDCGANIGLATLWFLRRYPAAHLTAFEPDPAICDVLRRNLRRNGAGHVEVIPAAVWRSDGVIAFRAEGSDAGAIDAVAPDLPGPITEVPCVRLRSFLERAPVDLLKLDIEGAEFDVLDDARDVLPNVRAIVLEIHDFHPGRGRRLVPRCLSLLEAAGYVYALDDLRGARWGTSAASSGPFQRGATSWNVLVRAWRATPNGSLRVV